MIAATFPSSAGMRAESIREPSDFAAEPDLIPDADESTTAALLPTGPDAQRGAGRSFQGPGGNGDADAASAATDSASRTAAPSSALARART